MPTETAFINFVANLHKPDSISPNIFIAFVIKLPWISSSVEFLDLTLLKNETLIPATNAYILSLLWGGGGIAVPLQAWTGL